MGNRMHVANIDNWFPSCISFSETASLLESRLNSHSESVNAILCWTSSVLTFFNQIKCVYHTSLLHTKDQLAFLRIYFWNSKK